MARRIYIATFGCQMNKLDSELLLGEFIGAGYDSAGSAEDADVIIFNACAVRRHAEERVYSHIGRLKHLKRRNPGAVIGLVGCMAQSEKERAFELAPHLDFVAGPGELSNVRTLAESALQGKRRLCAFGEGRFDPVRHSPGGKNAFQAYVSIMEGCDNFCSYCVVPLVRGREYSRPAADIISECGALAAAGVKEITLLGQNVNSYGRELGGGGNLAGLLRRLGEIEGLKRIRFLTNHPKDLSDELLNATSDIPSVCPHLSLPAQSGSDGILDAMNRKYKCADYERLLERARRIVPDIEFTSDFIVGFPGETDTDFEKTVNLIESAGFLNAYVFKYSPRPGTKAAELRDDVPMEVKKERNNRLLVVQKQAAAKRQRRMESGTLEVLVEGPSPRDPEKLAGRSRMNHIVVFPGEPGMAGKFVRIRILKSSPLTLFGEVADGK
jgi:tRNA-2-methylthio-N6-dimethylallyladenosine synthase